MRKLLLCAIAATGSLLTMQARQLTPTQALTRALDSDIPGITPPSRGASAPVLVYTVTEPSTGDNGVYVFNRADAGGYLIVSADDSTPALLGYADEGSFSLKEMPDGLRYMIEEYARQVAWASQNQTPSRATAERPTRAAIAPMVTTLWNQSSPYNDLCPLDNGKRSVTGCVATAMAQILKYHNYPAEGKGTHSYVPKNIGSTVSFDFGATTFEWDKMLDSYTSTATDEQKKAVATLMLACGVSVDMDYTSDESGASPYAPAPAFINYFGYDNAAAYQSRSLYGILDWEDLIYDNLKTCGPVLLDGQSGTGGHEFVCDGYSTDGYFHINWGWGGMSNGYFLLTALDPGSQGIGGSAGGYNFSQGAVTGIRPPVEGSTAPITMVSQTDINGSVSGNNIILTGQFCNMSSVTVKDLKLGVEINGNYYPSIFATRDLAPNYFTQNIDAPINGLPAGTYDVYPAFMCDGQAWTRFKAPIMNVDHVVLTAYSDGTYAVAQPEASYSLDITDMKLGTPLSPGKKFSLSALAVNSGTAEFYSTVVLALINA
ncbi:MAG: C10 family peptidase, partial [Duncaniella sp.]|nr:C10 family peptidase [Duncaniella sp.]